jgi:hypothetical protein
MVMDLFMEQMYLDSGFLFTGVRNLTNINEVKALGYWGMPPRRGGVGLSALALCSKEFSEVFDIA